MDATEEDRPLYGIDGPRRRPRRAGLDDAPVVRIPRTPPVEPSPVVEARTTTPDDLRARWIAESKERTRDAERSALTDQRFALLRAELVAEIGNQIDAAVGRMQSTFEHEIEALRNLNREEAKRMRSANGEAFVRVGVTDAQKLERIRTSIEEGIDRLCGTLDGQLDRMWAASDTELERIRSTGADRLAEVHDLLVQDLARVRRELAPPRSERRWLRRRA